MGRVRNSSVLETQTNPGRNATRSVDLGIGAVGVKSLDRAAERHTVGISRLYLYYPLRERSRPRICLSRKARTCFASLGPSIHSAAPHPYGNSLTISSFLDDNASNPLCLFH